MPENSEGRLYFVAEEPFDLLEAVVLLFAGKVMHDAAVSAGDADTLQARSLKSACEKLERSVAEAMVTAVEGGG
jgi:hypothetical protein